jgi:Domain of unknown function (DUF4326)
MSPQHPFRDGETTTTPGKGIRYSHTSPVGRLCVLFQSQNVVDVRVGSRIGFGFGFGDRKERDEAMTKRVQLRRIKGWRKPEGAISVARPHKWGNPFIVGTPGVPDAQTAVRLYRQWLPGTPLYREVSELSGHDLMCFCPLDQPCHADVLLELANP